MDADGCPLPQPCTFDFTAHFGAGYNTDGKFNLLPAAYEPVETGDRICGGDGRDSVEVMNGGTFDGGADSDGVFSWYGGTCINVESADGCPTP